MHMSIEKKYTLHMSQEEIQLLSKYLSLFRQLLESKKKNLGGHDVATLAQIDRFYERSNLDDLNKLEEALKEPEYWEQ